MLKGLRAEQEMYMAAVRADMRLLKLTTALEHRVWLLLNSVSEGTRWVPVEQRALAEMCSVSVNTVSAAIRVLVEKKLIERRRVHKSYEYRTAANTEAHNVEASELRLMRGAKPSES
ncbi:helix-turn-helix domain-containing protein [Leisingera aquaemixtae]|mgnify:CR=1 FL=1|uniref:helix-turn-helix domain-containing protein n=2 Tax=Roseobacteraceae TaxID=2854170 RepID=UPI002FDE59D7